MKQPIKVVQLLPDMVLGGVERGVVELSRYLVNQGMESVVISRHGELINTVLADGGQHVHYDCGSKNILTLPYRAFQLREILMAINPSIIHVRSRVPAWLLYFAGAHLKWSVVSTCHGMYSINRYSAQMTRAKKVICPSTAMVDYVQKNYHTPTNKVRLIHRGIDFDYFTPTKVDKECSLALQTQFQLQGKKIIALVGRLSSLKGHGLFLMAFAKAYQKDNNLLAIIVGDDDKNPQRLITLKDTAQSLGIGDAVRFVGKQQQMREIYHLSDVVVSASTKPEAFGRTVVEALAMNCLTIAPAHGGAMDIIQANKNGILFTPSDCDGLATAMLSVFELPKIDLRESVSAFSLQQMVQKTRAVYDEVLAK